MKFMLDYRNMKTHPKEILILVENCPPLYVQSISDTFIFIVLWDQAHADQILFFGWDKLVYYFKLSCYFCDQVKFSIPLSGTQFKINPDKC